MRSPILAKRLHDFHESSPKIAQLEAPEPGNLRRKQGV